MFNRDQADRELDEELRAYVDLLTKEKIKLGMSADAGTTQPAGGNTSTTRTSARSRSRRSSTG